MADVARVRRLGVRAAMGFGKVAQISSFTGAMRTAVASGAAPDRSDAPLTLWRLVLQGLIVVGALAGRNDRMGARMTGGAIHAAMPLGITVEGAGSIHLGDATMAGSTLRFHHPGGAPLCTD